MIVPMDPSMWSRIGAALDYYIRLGYEYVDVPWLVEQHEYWATKPPGIRDVHVPVWDRYLVASAEQGFLAQMRHDVVYKNAVTVSPCFRHEVNQNPRTHHPYFMKVELISTTKTVEDVLADAAGFMGQYTVTETVTTSGGLDLEVCGIEVGSYGRRRYRHYEYVYGTGLAEPRFGYARERMDKAQSGMQLLVDHEYVYDVCVQVLAEHPDKAEDYRQGRNVLGFLVGQVLRATKGRANGTVVAEAPKEILGPHGSDVRAL